LKLTISPTFHLQAFLIISGFMCTGVQMSGLYRPTGYSTWGTALYVTFSRLLLTGRLPAC